MARALIPVDLFNPGQVFGCIGLVELSEVLLGPTRGAFDWSDPSATRFVLEAPGPENPVEKALLFLAEAEVESLSPGDEQLATEKWKVVTQQAAPAHGYPTPPPSSPAALPAVLTANGVSMTISSWGEANLPEQITSRRDNVKFWAGAAGYPGAGLLRDALDAIRGDLVEAVTDPFGFSAPQSSSFRFDWRRDYIPIDVGFSLNMHGGMQPRGYPLVEILAVIGLSHARPRRVHKLQYRYAIVSEGSGRGAHDIRLLPAAFLRAALGTAVLPFPQRTFTMHLDWPGQENQARCITQVLEENVS